MNSVLSYLNFLLNAVCLFVVFTNRSFIDFMLKKEGARSEIHLLWGQPAAREICIFATGFYSLSFDDLTSQVTLC